MVSFGMNSPRKEPLATTTNSREEASPSYETYEASSIFALKKSPSVSGPTPHRKSSPGAGAHKRRLSDVTPKVAGSRRGNLLTPSGRRSSLLGPSGVGDLTKSSVRQRRGEETQLNLPSENFDSEGPLRNGEMRGLFSDKLGHFELPRLSLWGKVDPGEDSLPQSGNTFSQGFARYNADSLFPNYNYDRPRNSKKVPGGRTEARRHGLGSKGSRKSVPDNLVVTKHVCNCGMLEGRTHIHRVGVEVILFLSFTSKTMLGIFSKTKFAL